MLTSRFAVYHILLRRFFQIAKPISQFFYDQRYVVSRLYQTPFQLDCSMSINIMMMTIAVSLVFLAKNFIPGRPVQKQNDWASQPGVTVYLHQDKKSSIPIPVKTGSAAVQSKGSFPLQMRKMSPNMNIGSVVPHHAEYGKSCIP